MPLHLYITSSSCNKMSSYSNNYCLRFKDKSLINLKKNQILYLSGFSYKENKKNFDYNNVYISSKKKIVFSKTFKIIS